MFWLFSSTWNVGKYWRPQLTSLRNCTSFALASMVFGDSVSIFGERRSKMRVRVPAALVCSRKTLELKKFTKLSLKLNQGLWFNWYYKKSYYVFELRLKRLKPVSFRTKSKKRRGFSLPWHRWVFSSEVVHQGPHHPLRLLGRRHPGCPRPAQEAQGTSRTSDDSWFSKYFDIWIC